MTIINQYQNGNTWVTIFDDGTKIREYNNLPNVKFPESIDIKITNYCDQNCKYCHESSTTIGKHADLNKLFDVISVLPSGVELAIGGGNPLSHPDLVEFLVRLKEMGFISNITVNQNHLARNPNLLIYLIEHQLIYGLGISIVNNDFSAIKTLSKLTSNIVFHVIAGINEVDIMDKLIQFDNPKILILGYKTFGRGSIFYNQLIENNIKEWYRYIAKYIGKCILSFDNLAIEQLKIKRLFTEDGWNQFYMGDDFQFSMYIDGVNKQFSPMSASNDRIDFTGLSVVDYFGRCKKKVVD